MKTVIRSVLFVLLISLVLPLAVVSAQEGEGTQPIAPEISAIYYLSAASGSFADQGDGTYLLTLEGVEPEIMWLISAPALYIYRLGAAGVAEDWAASDALEAEAVLETNGLNILLVLSAAAYDEESGIQQYTASVTDVISLEEAKPEVPETFDQANLSVRWTPEFQNGLVAGVESRFEGMRAVPASCAEGIATWTLCKDSTYFNQHVKDCMDASFYITFNCRGQF